MRTILLWAFGLAPVVHIVEKYLFADWQFLYFLMVLVGVDTVTGFAKHWKSKTISSTGFGRVLIKTLSYGAVLILTHVLKNYQVAGTTNIVFSWIDDIMYSGIVIKEAISILENVAELNPALVPIWILKRLKQFDESGNLKELKGGANETN